MAINSNQSSITTKFVFPFKKKADYKLNQILVFDPSCDAFVNKTIDFKNGLLGDFNDDVIYSHESIADGISQVLTVPWKTTAKKNLLIFINGVKLHSSQYDVETFNEITNIMFSSVVANGSNIEVVGYEFQQPKQILVANGTANSPVETTLNAVIPSNAQVFVYLMGTKLDTSEYVLSYNSASTTTTITFNANDGDTWEVVALFGLDPIDVPTVNFVGDDVETTIILPWVASNKMQLYVSVDGFKVTDFELNSLGTGETELIFPSAIVDGVLVEVTGIYGLFRAFSDQPQFQVNGTNVGAGDGQVFRSASVAGTVSSLTFRTINGGPGVDVTTDADNVIISTDPLTFSMENIGDGVELVAQTTAPFEVKTLIGGDGINIDSTSDEVTISFDNTEVDAWYLDGLDASYYATTITSAGSNQSESLVKKASAEPNSTFELFGLRQGSGIVISKVEDDIVIADANGGNYVRIEDNYTIELDDSIVGVDSTNGPVTVTLVPITLAGTGKTLIVKDEAGNAGTNSILVSAGSGSTIDNEASVIINENGGAVILYCDGNDWFRIDSADSVALDGKVDIASIPSIVYATTNASDQTTIGYSSGASLTNTIAQRTAQGNLHALTLNDTDVNASANDLTNRAYVATLRNDRVTHATLVNGGARTMTVSEDVLIMEGSGVSDYAITLPSNLTVGKKVIIAFQIGGVTNLTIDPGTRVGGSNTIDRVPTVAKPGDVFQWGYDTNLYRWTVVSEMGTDGFSQEQWNALDGEFGSIDTALQPGDNISELVNDVGYLVDAKLFAQTTNGVSTVLTVDGSIPDSNNSLVLSDSSTVLFRGRILARESATSDSKAWTFEGVVKRGTGAATIVLIDTVTPEIVAADISTAPWMVVVDVNTTLGSLEIIASGEDDKTITWNVSLESLGIF